MIQQATCDVAKVVRRAARRKLGLFARFHEYDLDDLIQEGLVAVEKAADRMDPSIASRATFIYTLASRRMIDVWRKRSREVAREERVARPAVDMPQGTFIPESVQADWVESTYRGCQKTYGHRLVRVGPKRLRIAQVATVLLLMRRLQLTADQTQILLASREDLRRAAGFLHTPGRNFFKAVFAMIEAHRAADEDVN